MTTIKDSTTVEDAVGYAMSNELISVPNRKAKDQNQIEAEAVVNLTATYWLYADEYGIPYDVFKAEMKRQQVWDLDVK